VARGLVAVGSQEIGEARLEAAAHVLHQQANAVSFFLERLEVARIVHLCRRALRGCLDAAETLADVAQVSGAEGIGAAHCVFVHCSDLLLIFYLAHWARWYKAPRIAP